MNTSRDTQFAGFAKALLEELLAIETEGLRKSWNNLDMYRRQREAIARRTYDLVGHTIDYVDPKDLDMLERDECIGRIPDLTELPREGQ